MDWLILGVFYLNEYKDISDPHKLKLIKLEDAFSVSVNNKDYLHFKKH